jgi:iron complex outermembrane recepter protein
MKTKKHLAIPLVLLAGAAPAWAQEQTVPGEIVVHTTPASGAVIDERKWPHPVHTLSRAELKPNGTASLTDALIQEMPGVTQTQSQGNPYQPDIFYHGFEISPIQGTPAGLSVYVDGARFNAPFGDIAIWSLLPSEAIASLSVQDGNPAYGLNALGGAVDVRMKNGFTDPGGEISLSGGSFGRIEGNLEYGVQSGNMAAYVDISGTHEGGWRDGQSSDIQNFYGDLGWRNDNTELHINLTVAHSALNGPGSVPVEVLAADSSAQFTGPNRIDDKYVKLAATLNHSFSNTLSMNLTGYIENLHEGLTNGNGPNDTPCGPGPNEGYLCQDDGSVATAVGGVPIPAYLGDNASNYGQLAENSTNTNAFGLAGQLTNTGKLLGHGNTLTAGLSLDGAYTMYGAAAYDGAIGLNSRVYYTPSGTPNPGYEVDEPGTVPTRVGIRNVYYGAYLSDTFDLTDRLSLTAAGRLNLAQINLHNQLPADPNAAGGGLNGQHYYSHFNPAVGLSYQLTPELSAYAGWSEQNAVPTPAELSCASPEDSCTLANFMSGDPPLKQMVTREVQAGLRGATPVPGGGLLTYTLDLFRSVTNDDIEFLQSPLNPQGAGYFSNVGNVRRQGVELGLRYETARWHTYLNYSFTDATYQNQYIVSSTYNPGADANGDTTVYPGDHLPGVPSHVVKAGVTYDITPRWSIGLNGTAQSSQYLAGDAANLQKPLPGSVVLNLTSSYWVTRRLQVFGSIENLLDQTYYTYGTFSPTSGNGGVYVAQAPNYSNPRSYSIGAPIGVFVGLRYKL